MEDDDFIIDEDDFMPKKKKINSGRKGKSRERDVAKILSMRFKTGFSRSVGSGARTSQVANLPKHAKDTFSGDLVTPANFKFTVECKGGYDDIDLNSVFDGGHSEIDSFLDQASTDAEGCGRIPLVVWKKNHKPYIAIIKTAILPKQDWEYRLIYRDWSLVNFKELLELPDSFWLT
jgi:hypothetical protein